MDKKNKYKAGLSFGIVMAIIFILQDLIIRDDLTTKSLIITVVSALFGGTLAGLLFGWLMGLFANAQLWEKGTKINIEADETIVLETGANHFKNAEAVGGKLYLTNKRLVFKSHTFNVQHHELSMPLADIDKVNSYKTWRLVNNGLSVTTTKGTIEKFVVQQREQWLSQLTGKNNLPPLHLQ